MMDEYSVLTFATNKFSYLKFAFNLARSVALHNKNLPVYIVTNLNVAVPAKLKNTFIVPVDNQLAEKGLELKLQIDQFLQTTNTLFIDADCLCFDNLAPLFKAFEGNDLSVIGEVVAAEEWCGATQAKTIKNEFNLDSLARFNAGVIYLKRSEKTKQLMDKVRKIAEKYDTYGFIRNTKWINEEGPMSIVMMLNMQIPVPDNGTYMTDLFTDPRPAKMNVLNGKRVLKNPAAPSFRHRPWYPAQYSPAIIHFGGRSFNSYPYIAQNVLLVLSGIGLPVGFCNLINDIFIRFPYQTAYCLIGSLRKLKTSSAK